VHAVAALDADARHHFPMPLRAPLRAINRTLTLLEHEGAAKEAFE
jgi:hypothetical protein